MSSWSKILVALPNGMKVPAKSFVNLEGQCIKLFVPFI
jgi:hypothetical protein